MSASGWRRGGDHYYWLTAFLAAHDLQRRTCRTVAASIFGLGAIGPILSLGMLGPGSTAGMVVMATVTCCCVVMTLLWLRPGWPSRRVSWACVVVGTVCIAASSIVVPSHSLGILGTTTYAVLGSFVVVFHSLRLLVFTWTVGASALIYLAVLLAEDDVSMAVATVLLIVLVNVFAVFACRMVVRLIANDTPYGDLERVTGLPGRDAFFEKVSTLIGARTRDDDRRLVVVVVNLDGYSLMADVRGRAEADGARVGVARALRETARRDAIIAHPGDAEFWIADLFTTLDPHPLAERIRGAVAGSRSGLSASVGVVCTPLEPLATVPTYDVVEELVNIAISAMFEARRAGGNQTRDAIDPALTVLADPTTDQGFPSV
jgi:GGDEF domain-containing protein